LIPHGFAVLRCFCGNYQRASRRPPQKSWAAGDPAREKTAKTPAVPPLFFAVFAPKNSDNRENRINVITRLLHTDEPMKNTTRPAYLSIE
jgi:hypothetical protein